MLAAYGNIPHVTAYMNSDSFLSIVFLPFYISRFSRNPIRQALKFVVIGYIIIYLAVVASCSK